MNFIKMLRRSILMFFVCLSTIVLYGQGDESNEKSMRGFDYRRVNRALLGVNKIELFSPSVVEDKVESFGTRIWSNMQDDIANSTGRVDLGYSYGLNTVFTDTSRGISSVFNTFGAFNTAIIGLPVEVSFNYSTLRHPLGANNYFRISFDKERFLTSQKSKIDEQFVEIDNYSSKIKDKKVEFSKLQSYSEVYLDMLKRRIQRESKSLIDSLKKNIIDSLEEKTSDIEHRDYSFDGYQSSDSLHQTINSQKERIETYQKEYDSIMGIYQKILTAQQKYDSLLNVYEEYQEKLSSYSSGIKDFDVSNQEFPSTGSLGFVKSIQKIDIGLTYPQTTGLSTQTTPIKGIGTEFQHNQFYLSVSSGLTLNNVMLSTNEITNQLEYNQNVFNQFDFQRVKDNGLLTTLKTGWGAPEQTHAFIGFNYLTNTRFLGNDSSAYDPAAAFELDFRYVPKFYTGGAIDVVYGKTSSNKQEDTLSQLGVFESLFSTYQSSAFLTKYTQEVSSLRSDFSLQFRSIDPYANTTVYGFMQPGNRRYAFESRHRVASYLRLGTTYRIDETYGNSSYSYKLNTVGVNASGIYTEYFSYSVMFNHVKYSLRKPASTTERGNNYLAGINLQSNYTWKNLDWVVGVTYNDYLISDTLQVNKYTQFGIAQSMGNKKWDVFYNYNYFFQSSLDLVTGTHVLSIGGRYNLEDMRLKAGVSLASEKGEEESLGGYIDVLYQINQWMDISFRAERFVLGGFYRDYYRNLYERFPYFVSVNLGLKF